MSNEEIDALIRAAGRALARHGLVHAYGHCSIRATDNTFRVSAAKPLGLITDADACLGVPLEGQLPDGMLGEVRVHREIYRLRPDVNAIVRCTPPRTVSLSAMMRAPRSRHGFGSYFYPSPPLWSDPRLLRDDEQAMRLANFLGTARAVVIRGNGAVVTGESIQQALALTWYLEDSARVELDCLAVGLAETGLMTRKEAAARAVWNGRIAERMWDYLTAEPV